MMDFEVMKVKDSPVPQNCKFVMQADNKFWTVPFDWRNKNRHKLILMYQRGDFHDKEYKTDTTLSLKK
jgi:hypothetical protein